MVADDYVKKPVEPRVLLARIRALLRRARPAALCEPKELASLSFGSLKIERASRRVVLDGTPIELTTNEIRSPLAAGQRRRQCADRAGHQTECN